jgi:SAM-dependent methyltransferase
VEASPPLTLGDRGTLCPCCGSSAVRLLESIRYREIWNGLREDSGVRFSDEVIRRNTPGEETPLLECGSCGVYFFDRAVAGDAEFYHALGQSPKYYSTWKWEFDWVRSRLPSSAEVLDVGCGSGDFLAAVAPGTRRAIGLDWSPAAVALARARGLEAVEGDLSVRAAGFEGAFDAVCAFHVLEHLPEPVTFLGLLRRCLRPGGSLFLSVPNRMRSGRASLEPLDCPPHHLTRWSPESLEALARRLHLVVVETATQPVDPSVPRDRLQRHVRSLAEKIPLVGGFLGTWLPPLAWRVVLSGPLIALYRRLGVLERVGFYGLSAVMRCKEPSS